MVFVFSLLGDDRYTGDVIASLEWYQYKYPRNTEAFNLKKAYSRIEPTPKAIQRNSRGGVVES
jgi:hypothetical protein